MKRALIVIYEFQTPFINNRSAIETRLRQYGQYAFLTKDSCLIFTESPVIVVRDYLLAALANGDKLYVGEASGPAAWCNLPNEVSEYLRNNLK